MITSCKKILPFYAPESNAQIIDLPIEQSRQILISEKGYLALKCEVGYWRAMHHKSSIREEILKQTIKEQEGKIQDLKHRVFGKKSEKKSSNTDQIGSKEPNPKRCRGQQPGSKGHGRTQRLDLPLKKEDAKFLEDPICPCCNEPYIPDASKEAELLKLKSRRIHVRLNVNI